SARDQIPQLLKRAGPLVTNLIFLKLNPIQEGGEVAVAILLPARLELLRPFGVGRRVVPFVHGRWRPLKDIELLRMLAQMRNALDRRGSRPDDTYPFVPEFVQASGGIP